MNDASKTVNHTNIDQIWSTSFCACVTLEGVQSTKKITVLEPFRYTTQSFKIN